MQQQKKGFIGLLQMFSHCITSIYNAVSSVCMGFEWFMKQLHSGKREERTGSFCYQEVLCRHHPAHPFQFVLEERGGSQRVDELTFCKYVSFISCFMKRHYGPRNILTRRLLCNDKTVTIIAN